MRRLLAADRWICCWLAGAWPLHLERYSCVTSSFAAMSIRPKIMNLPFAVERPGVNVELLQYGPTELVDTLERIGAANFRWIRQFAYWDEIEAQPGEYDWSGMGSVSRRHCAIHTQSNRLSSS